MSSDASFYALTAQYPDEAAAVRYFEERRWPHGVNCPKCGSVDVLRGNNEARNRQLWYCHSKGCETQFSVTSGTIMEFTKLPLRKWMLAFHFIGASKKGISSLQLSRMLDITYKTAWHLAHRIRATMTKNDQMFSGIVETDELYVGGKRRGRGRGYRGNKIAVQTIVKRGRNPKCKDLCLPGDKSRAQTIALNNGQKVDGRTVGAKLHTHTDPERTILMTDDSPIYDRVGEGFAEHHTVNHSAKVYARVSPDGRLVTTNTAEGLFANLRRQLTGTHHHTSQKHLPKYLEEYDFKYNTREVTDTERTEQAIGNIEGRSLKLYKPAVGGGESLYDRKYGDPVPEPGVVCKTHGRHGAEEGPCADVGEVVSTKPPRKRAKRPPKGKVAPSVKCPGPLCPCSECVHARIPGGVDVERWAAERDVEYADGRRKRP